MTTMKQWFNYWLVMLVEAKARGNRLLDLCSMLPITVVILIRWFGQSFPSVETFFASAYGDWVTALAAAYALGYLVIWAPFAKHRQQENIHEGDRMRWQRERSELAGEIVRLTTSSLDVSEEPTLIEAANVGAISCGFAVTNSHRTRTAERITVDVLALDNELGSSGWAFPMRVRDEMGDLNPGGTSWCDLFWLEFSGVEEGSDRAVLTGRVQISSTGPTPQIRFLAGRKYGMKVRITAKDFPALREHITFDFTFDAELTGRLNITKQAV